MTLHTTSMYAILLTESIILFPNNYGSIKILLHIEINAHHQTSMQNSRFYFCICHCFHQCLIGIYTEFSYFQLIFVFFRSKMRRTHQIIKVVDETNYEMQSHHALRLFWHYHYKCFLPSYPNTYVTKLVLNLFASNATFFSSNFFRVSNIRLKWFRIQ